MAVMTAAESLALQRGLPSNIEAEQFVLGSILLDDSVFPQVAGALKAADFNIEKHRRIFQRMAELHERGERIEYLTVVEELEKHTQLESCDGIAYISSLTDGLPRLSSIDSYIRIVKDKSRLRKLIFTAQGIVAKCIDGGLDAEEEIRAALDQLTDRLNESSGGATLQSLNLPDVNDLPDGGDWILGGLVAAGGVTLIAGEPGAGKSLLALSLAGAVATGVPFLGRATIRRPVLYLDRENHVGLVKTRYDTLGLPSQDEGLFVWGRWARTFPPGPESRLLVQIAQRERPLMIFDSLISFHSGDENSASDTRRFFAPNKRGRNCRIDSPHGEIGDGQTLQGVQRHRSGC